MLDKNWYKYFKNYSPYLHGIPKNTIKNEKKMDFEY